ncbi:MAG: PilN domain-containing protein [Nitrospirae bacterium]|nr:PilN domain-containing protein [Nitrospirota bacterium]
MIRINLLPVKRKKKPKPIPGFVVATVVASIIVIVGVVFAYVNIKEEIKTLQARKTANEQKLQELKKKLKALENYETLVKAVERKKGVILQLRKNQGVPVRLMDELSKDLPNGIWLKELKTMGNTVDIEGYAFTNSDVVKYVNRLKKSPLFNSVYLAESKRKEISAGGTKEKIPVYNFKIKLGVKV